MSHDPHGSEDREAGRRQMGRTYQAAFEAVMAVAVAGVAGAFADTWLGTTPLLLLVGVVVGFGAFVLRMVRLMNELAARSGDGDASGPGGERQDGEQ